MTRMCKGTVCVKSSRNQICGQLAGNEGALSPQSGDLRSFPFHLHLGSLEEAGDVCGQYRPLVRKSISLQSRIQSFNASIVMTQDCRDAVQNVCV